MDIYSLLKYIWSLPSSHDPKVEPYTEDKSTFVMKHPQNPNEADGPIQLCCSNDKYNIKN